MQNLPYFFWTCPPRPSSEHVPVIDWLRRHAQAGDVVYTEKSLAETYAQWSGLPQVHSEATTDDFGFPPAILEAREQLVNERPDAIEPYLREGVRWIVLDREDSEMERIVGAWESEGRAHQTAGFERIRIVELH
jgi:hypothetical protein